MSGSPDDRPGADADEEESRQGGWTRALAFSGLGLEFLVAVGVGMYLGGRLDARFGTTPALTLACAMLFLVGAVAHVYRMFRRLTDAG